MFAKLLAGNARCIDQLEDRRRRNQSLNASDRKAYNFRYSDLLSVAADSIDQAAGKPTGSQSPVQNCQPVADCRSCSDDRNQKTDSGDWQLLE